ncbi:AAA family ATPase [Rhizobium sp. Root708]|uniref:AAA family ATPase n=1 Tax=Rhizobium sp. Root708 TaxID=1736592 RepID=UPI0006F9624B|nr:AAA family ATPase [Rhizobium sp. Root708]KRB53002.1 AAA family ATPase [Rhizobium sp. Root708]
MPAYIEDTRKAAGLLRQSTRIMIIGCSGGGKSTLSRKISRRLDLPYFSMDKEFFWLPGWVKRSKEEERRLITEVVAGERWLMDGTGPSTFDLRVPRVEFVVWVRMPRWLCLWGISKRAFFHFGRTRPDMAPGCLERLPDREFLTYIWTFEKRSAPLVIAGLDKHAPDVPVFQLKSRRQVHHLLDLLGAPT